MVQPVALFLVASSGVPAATACSKARTAELRAANLDSFVTWASCDNFDLPRKAARRPLPGMLMLDKDV